MSTDGFALLDDVMYALGMHYAETIVELVRWSSHRESKRFQMCNHWPRQARYDTTV